MSYKDFLYQWRPEADYLRYLQWRRQVFRRDRGRCQWCGATSGERHADHIRPWARHPASRYDVANGRVLCRDCHVQRHQGILERPHRRTRRRYAAEIAQEVSGELSRPLTRAEQAYISPTLIDFMASAVAATSACVVPHYPASPWWRAD